MSAPARSTAPKPIMKMPIRSKPQTNTLENEHATPRPNCEEASQPTPELLSSLSTLLHTRHSTRAFLSQPIPPELIHQALALAQQAPSNSNIQNWRAYLVTGSALQRVSSRLTAAAQECSPKIPPLPSKFARFRSELGYKIYGEGYGVPRSDVALKLEKTRRNYRFFDAPAAVIVCMDHELANHDALSVGMWLQSFVLALTSQGLSSCVEVSVAGYKEVLKQELAIPEDVDVLCGVAVGWEDKSAGVNGVRSGRRDWRECVVEATE